MNNSFNKKCDYTHKQVSQLSAKEIEDLKENLIEGNKLCPICHDWTNHVMRIPQKYKDNKFFYKSGGYRRGFLKTPVESFSFFENKIVKCCTYCISSLATIYRKNRNRHYNLNHGIIDYNISVSLRPNLNNRFGVVYVAKFKEGYKIGATVSSVNNRLAAYGCAANRFVCAIGCKHPFDLESFFHGWYKEKNVNLKGSREVFNLDADDLNWIKSIKVVNSKKVAIFLKLNKVESYLDLQRSPNHS